MRLPPAPPRAERAVVSPLASGPWPRGSPHGDARYFERETVSFISRAGLRRAHPGPGYVWRRWLTVYEYLDGFDSRQGRHSFAFDRVRPGSWSKGKMLLPHSSDRGSIPLESTVVRLFRVRGRTARHAAATRSIPVRLRADARMAIGISSPGGEAVPTRRSWRVRFSRSRRLLAHLVFLAGHAPLVRERGGFESLGGLRAAVASTMRSPLARLLPRADATRVSEAW